MQTNDALHQNNSAGLLDWGCFDANDRQRYPGRGHPNPGKGAGPTGREIPTQGFGRRPMPWVEGAARS
jgi:hypothetical protein